MKPPFPYQYKAIQRPSDQAIAPHAFTLTELLVVISIILILVAIGVPAFTGAFRQSSKAITQSTLQSAMAVETEMRATRGKILYHLATPSSFGQYGEIEYFVDQARKSETSRKMVEALPLGDKDKDGFDEIWDDLDNPIRYRSGNDSGSGPKHPTPFFHAAGPDKKFGSKDDILSFEIDQ